MVLLVGICRKPSSLHVQACWQAVDEKIHTRWLQAIGQMEGIIRYKYEVLRDLISKPR